MQLSDITTQVTGLMNRRDFTASTSLQTTFINQGIMRLQRELRVPAMEKSINVTFGIGTVTVGTETFWIGAGTYNSTTGAVTLTGISNAADGTQVQMSPGLSVVVAGLQGTGTQIASLSGTFTAQAGSSGNTLVYNVAAGLNAVIGVMNTTLTIPNDLLELQDIIPAASNLKLTKVDITRALRYANGGTVSAVGNTAVAIPGNPEVYCRQGGVWVLGPSPEPGAVLRVDYWAELTPLVNPTDTNIISIIAWDLIVYAALVQAAIYYKDARKDDWEDQYQTAFSAIQEQSDDDDENAGAVVMPCYQMPIDWEFDHY